MKYLRNKAQSRPKTWVRNGL